MKKIRKAVNKVKTFVVDHSLEIFVAGITIVGAGAAYLQGVSDGKREKDQYYKPRLKERFDYGQEVGAYRASAAFIADHERAEKLALDELIVFNDDFEEIYGDAKREKIVAEGLEILEENEKA